jgi:hypothetical protein
VSSIALKRITPTAVILAIMAVMALAASGAPAQVPDTQPPVFLGASLTLKTINPFGSTVINYAVNENATVKAVFKRARPGRKVAGRCRAPTRRNRKRRRCTRFTNVGTLEQSIPSTTGSISFVGLMRGKPLKVGRYRIELTATDVAGNKSKKKNLTLRVCGSCPPR